MEKVIQKTYVQSIYDPRLLDLSKECASIYNQSMGIFWSSLEQDEKWLTAYDIQKQLGKFDRKLIGSNSYIATIQQFYNAVTTWRKSKNAYWKNRSKFSGEPQPPKKEKDLSPIYFKEENILYKDGYLSLTLKRGIYPIQFRWNIDLGKPIFAIISWKRNKGWFVSLVIEETVNEHQLDKNKVMSVDLGTKRTAATFYNNEVILYTGKYLKSLTRLRNKVNDRSARLLSKCKKHSRRYKRIKRACRKVANRIDNKVKDNLHKYSRTIINYCKANKIGFIAFGDNAGTHNDINLGDNNQSVQQNPEQRLRRYVEYKFEVIGGASDLVPEYYTSKTCPQCGQLNSTDTRDYHCRYCGFSYDRDGVGCINIYCRYKKVSFSNMDVIGLLTRPIGYKYKSNQDCLVS